MYIYVYIHIYTFVLQNLLVTVVWDTQFRQQPESGVVPSSPSYNCSDLFWKFTRRIPILDFSAQ